MRITQFTDYSLRVLLYLGLKKDIATIREITTAFRISNNHLMKVVHRLSQDGFINSFKGKNGGIELAVDPTTIRLGDFVKALEPMDLLECFDPATNTCPLIGVCQIERSLYEAREAFTDALNRYTLADCLSASAEKDERMRRLGLLPTRLGPKRAG